MKNPQISHTRVHTRVMKCVVATWTGLFMAGVALAQDAGSEVVGEITTAIGQGKIIGAVGERTIARGQRVHAGDKIETADGGHVHIRFVDGGLVSIRPLSRLLIEQYRNAKGAQLAAIKFKLEEGVIRSVTGQWGEANRDRFRLNTPIAAIGVKGTDFVVKVQPESTYASVVSGAIVMAPLDGACTGSLGPCQTDLAAHLSAEMQGQMLEYVKKNDNGGPRLVPSVDLLAQGATVNGAAAAQAVGGIASDAKLAGSDPLASGVLDSENAATPAGKPLVWLHNPLGWGVPENTISQSNSAAVADGRKAVVGNFFINLYRDETTLASFQPVGSSASFRLSGFSANYTPLSTITGPFETVQVTNPTLSVDFARSTFSTQLQLSSTSLGQETFNASGVIGANGVFTSAASGQSLAGAFSMDGRQAGYLFSKNVTRGSVGGLTLWGR